MWQRLFNKMRRRPVHERRILGVVSYLAIAAIILAGWLKSIPGTLGLATPQANSQIIAATNATNPQQASGLASPFAALKQSVQDLGQGITQLKQSFQNGVNNASSSDSSQTVQPDAQNYAVAPNATPQTGFENPTTNGIEPNGAGSPSEISTQILESPAATAPATPQQKIGLWASMEIALGGFVQSVINAVKALSG